MLHVNLGHGGGRWIGAKNEGRSGKLAQKWRIARVKVEIYRSLGIRSDPVDSRRCRIFFFFLFGSIVIACQFGNGGGRRTRAENEGRMGRITRKWRMLVVKGEIYRPAGIRSDPVASRRFRIFFLFVVFGVACQFGSWRRVVGRIQK